ncbi:tetratricopeptide repeat protein [Actinoplanes sp. NEAU-A12]|uniref:Tetratricopeptide repeat protein n=1 Tax=Actinoplanes sandaracinus TaxID=3045177 RepID=A0ABT6WH45_9ACTN|nr:tetratricopeptide repeat protein [Actinoplanes sandaracinus]MDI6099051.1 tetratricopeptide repeat protein [Actinoplanes sandaracinus]MDI6102946.1 tetratricopeptide repeat protein [Actinoplanes sandaracinus]
MKTADELWQLLGEAQEMPYGATQIALVDQVLRHVDATDDPALKFSARLFATTAYIYGGEQVKAFPSFSWCVADFDRNPSPYHERWMHNLLWLFKNMVSSMTKFPEVPLGRTYAVLDDMERRYRESGHGMQPVYKHRYLVAEHVGQTEEAAEWFRRWQAEPRNRLSDCSGCDPTTLVNHLARAERFEEAAELAAPVLAGDLSCNEQPQSILGELMVVYLKTGRLREAADAHRRSYLVMRNNLADLWEISEHIQFCARTGNEHRGLEILQRHIDWLERAPSPAAAMNFAAGSVLLLRRLTELGHGDTLIRRGGRDDITAAALAEELTTFATGLAARFDARNGTDHQSTVITGVMTAEPYGVKVPLSATARRVPVTAGAGTEQAGAVTGRPVPVVEPEPPIEVPSSATAADLIELAEQYSKGSREDAARTVMEAFDARFEVPEEPALAARLWALRGFLLPADAHEETVAAWDRGVDLFTRAGEVGEANMLRARVALERAQSEGPSEELLAIVQSNADYQDEHGDPAIRAAAWMRVSQMLRLLDRPGDANEAGDRSDRCAEEAGDQRQLAYHALVRAQNREAAHQHEEAVAAARAAWDFYREHGPAGQSAEAAMVFGQLTDDPEQAVEALTETLAAGLPAPALAARIHRGRALVRLDRAEEAIDDFVEAIALCAEGAAGEGSDRAGLFARHELAQAYHHAGRPAEAAEVGEEALLGFDRLGFEEPAGDTRLLLATVYRDLGDTDRALSIYRHLIEWLEGNPAGRGQVGEQAGQLLYDMDRDSEAALTFRAAAESLHEAGDLAAELRVLRRRLMALNFADEVAEAEEVIRLATRRYEELPAELATQPGVLWGRSIFAFEVGNLLMRRGRYAEALPHLRDAPERLRGIGAADDADRVEGMLAEALLRSGSAHEAERILGALLKRMRPDAPTRELAVDLYDAALEAVNRLNDR